MSPKQMQDKIPRQAKPGKSAYHYWMLLEFLSHSMDVMINSNLNAK